MSSRRRRELPDDRIYRFVDTGGFDPEGKEPIPKAVAREGARGDPERRPRRPRHGRLGRRPAGRPGRGAGGARGGRRRPSSRRTRSTGKEGSEGEVEAWELGFQEVYGVSAEHAIGVDDIQAAIAANGCRPPLRKESQRKRRRTVGRRSAEIALAVVGRPNVGKSSLVNVLLGEEQTIVSDIAGTTRDSVDAALVHARAAVPAGGYGRDPPQVAHRARSRGPLGRVRPQEDRGVRRRPPGPRRQRGRRRPRTRRSPPLPERRARGSLSSEQVGPRRTPAGRRRRRSSSDRRGASSLRVPCALAPRVREDRARGLPHPRHRRAGGRQSPPPDHRRGS